MHRILIALIGINVSLASICLTPIAQAKGVPMQMPEIGIQTTMSQHTPICNSEHCFSQASGRETAPSNALPSMPTVALPSTLVSAESDPILQESIRVVASPPLLTHTNTVVLRE